MSLSKNEIKLVKSLQIKKYRESNGVFVVEGVKLLQELLQQKRYKIDTVFFTVEDELTIPPSIKKIAITEKELERISGLKQPNKYLAVVHTNSPSEVQFDQSPILLLDDLRDPGNLGTIIRTADWFGVKTIIASENSVDQYNPKVVQSSMGAIFRMQFLRQPLPETPQAAPTGPWPPVPASAPWGNRWYSR